MEMIRKLFVVGIILFLQGCASIHTLHGKLDTTGSPVARTNCEIKYMFTLTDASGHTWNPRLYQTESARRWTDTRLEEQSNAPPPDVEAVMYSYLDDVENTIARSGCRPSYVANTKDANLGIRVEMNPGPLVDFPQYPITFSSVGLIPTWARHKNVYTYAFTDVDRKTSHVYTVDELVIYHLVFVPVIWLPAFTYPADSEFSDALQNFMLSQ